jgi:hypothetical protein
MKSLLILFLGLAFAFETLGQSFVNGDLNGTINGLSSLPTSWQRVPYTDINCLAEIVGNDTPDLCDSLWGNPFSGNTFISGGFGSYLPNFFQEGIMQLVNGFTIGMKYSIRFRQAVLTNASLDKSGSWLVYIDTLLAGVTSPTRSDLPYNILNLRWEGRAVDFTAAASLHVIKFLPMDDDSNWVGATNDTTGALRMAIDSIGLEVITGINEINTAGSLHIFPNPSNGSFVLEGSNNNLLKISIQNTAGAMLYNKNIQHQNKRVKIDDAALAKGIYFVKVTTEYGMQCLKLVVQ